MFKHHTLRCDLLDIARAVDRLQTLHTEIVQQGSSFGDVIRELFEPLVDIRFGPAFNHYSCGKCRRRFVAHPLGDYSRCVACTRTPGGWRERGYEAGGRLELQPRV